MTNLMDKDHVKNHKWFKNLKADSAAKEKRIRKHAQSIDLGDSTGKPNLSDMFSSANRLGLLNNSKKLPDLIKTAILTAREVIDQFDFPISPAITYLGVKNVKTAGTTDDVLSGTIVLMCKFATVGGLKQSFDIPISVVSGKVLPPSVVRFQGRDIVLAQSSVNAMVQRASSYELIPVRKQFSPMLTRDERACAAELRNEIGYQAREGIGPVSTIRRTYKKAQEDSAKEELSNMLNSVVILRGCVSNEGVELRDSSGKSAPVFVAVVHDGSGYTPGAAVATSQRSSQGALEEAYEILEDHLFSGNGYLNEQDIEEARTTEDTEGYNPITERFDGAVFQVSPQDFQIIVEGAKAINGEELKQIEFYDYFEEDEVEDSGPEFEKESESDLTNKITPDSPMQDMDEAKKFQNEPLRAKKGLKKTAYDDPTSIYEYMINEEGAYNEANRIARGFDGWNIQDITMEFYEVFGDSWNLPKYDWEDVARMFINALEEDEGESKAGEGETPFTIYLDNLSDYQDPDPELDDMVKVHVSGPGAAAWAKEEHQSIAGSNWESTDPDFAYAIIGDSSDLIEQLKAEGYTDINDDEYSPPKRVGAKKAQILPQGENEDADPASGEMIGPPIFFPDDEDKGRDDFDETLIGRIFQWHGGQGTAEYSLGSTWNAGKSVPKELVQEVMDSFESMSTNPKYADQAEELAKLAGDLQMVLTYPEEICYTPEKEARTASMGTAVPAGYETVKSLMDKAQEEDKDTFPRSWIHVLRNYILEVVSTASQDAWATHLVNDGYVLNPYGNNNRGRDKTAQVEDEWQEDEVTNASFYPDTKTPIEVGDTVKFLAFGGPVRGNIVEINAGGGNVIIGSKGYEYRVAIEDIQPLPSTFKKMWAESCLRVLPSGKKYAEIFNDLAKNPEIDNPWSATWDARDKDIHSGPKEMKNKDNREKVKELVSNPD